MYEEVEKKKEEALEVSSAVHNVYFVQFFFLSTERVGTYTRIS